MKQLYYAWVMLLRGKGSNAIKIISLSLGLFVSVLLLARIMFEVNYDNHYENVDQLFRIKTIYTIGGERSRSEEIIINEPVPAAIKENFPDNVVSATVIRDYAGDVFFNGNHRIDQLESIYADSLYFQTMGIKVIKGNTKDLGMLDVVFISESFARKIYGDDDPIGKVLSKDKVYPLTVRGVFNDVPENSTLLHDLVLSFPTIHKISGFTRGGWNKDDSFKGYIRLQHPEDAEEINARLDAMVQKYVPDNGEKGRKKEYVLRPVKGEYLSYSSVQTMLLIMGILAIIVLAVVILNYILISISSLVRRAKSVAVHKCSGASNGNILSMFLIESAITMFIALLLTFFLYFSFKDYVEDLLYASLASLFTWQTISLVCGMVCILLLFVGVLPGRIFAKIPVTQVFKRFSEKKVRWKRPLLFMQFSGITFIFSLLVIILLQYDLLLNKNLGYNPENVAITNIGRSLDDNGFLKEELLRMPVVEKVAIAYMDIMTGWGGMVVTGSNGETLFVTRWNGADKDYVPLMELKLKEGRNIDGPNQVLVNESYVRQMRWTESPVGKPLTEIEDVDATIVGVLYDFPIRDRFGPIRPIVLEGYHQIDGRHYSVRVKHLTPEVLELLNQKVEELYPQEDIQFITLKERIEEQYEQERRFRDAVGIASIIILVITLMGLFGYVNDEVQRRSKEIAIRKINGAAMREILWLLARDVLYMALPASIIGAFGAYLVGYSWLDQFVEQIDMSVSIFLSTIILTLFFLLTCVVIKSWRIANDDPVNSIKNE